MLGAKVKARAKINLFLEVGGKRPDGFHELRSVMQSLELADELYFRQTPGPPGDLSISCSDRTIPTGRENLVVRAAEAFYRRTGVLAESGIECLINKRIPVGAGLAGGSADAAATIVALDHIFELGLTREEMAGIAAEVGSDVPFCLSGGTALVGGRGEQLQALEALSAYTVVLANPGLELSTASVYESFDESENKGEALRGEEMETALASVIEGIRRKNYAALCRGLRNNLETAGIIPATVEEYKSIAVGTGASIAIMTGSGPTVFALAPDQGAIAEIAWELEKTAPITIISRFSPVGAEITGV